MNLKPSQNAAIFAIGMYIVELTYIILNELSSDYLPLYLWLVGIALVISIASCVVYHEFVEKPEAKLEALKAESAGNN